MKGAAVVALGIVLVAGLTIRILALEVPGHAGDVRVMVRWAERIADVGSWRFYEDSASIYPALLYALWLLGSLLDGESLTAAIKALSIPFDLAIGVLLFTLVRPASSRAAVAAAAVFVLNPATILAGPVWGQVDAAGSLAYLGALAALASGRHGTAGGLATLAGLVKPQFGLVLLAVLAVTALTRVRTGTWRPLLRSTAGMLTAYLAVALPLGLDPVRYARLFLDTAGRQPETSLHAFNPWGLFVGFGVPDDRYVGLGTVLLLLGLAGALLGLRRRPSAPVLLGVGAVLALAFYFLPTRVHERYLFPALPLLAPFAVAGRRELVAYVAISTSFAASLVYALLETTSFELPEALAVPLTSDAGVWATGLVLMASAVAWTWMLIVRRPRWPSVARDRAA